MLRSLARLGLRSVNLLWFPANTLGDGLGEPRQAGLTGFGREVAREMGRIGMLPDVSQSSERAFWDIVEESTVPVIASHSNVAACCTHPRNLDDAMLRAIAETGGIIGLNGYTAMVAEDPSQATIDRLLDHAFRVIDVVGVEHVSFGLNIISDAVDTASLNRGNQHRSASHSGSEQRARRHLEGLEDVTELGGVLDRLEARGLTADEVDQAAFGNIERVVRTALEQRGA